MCELLQDIPQELQNLPFVIYPTSRNYTIDRFIFNKRFNIFPHAIIKPTTEQELVYALKVLRSHHLEFAVRSGGHCFEPGSLSTGYIIDLEHFNTIQIDVNKREVFVGAGARLGPVIQKLAQLGYAIPTGTCGSNGVAGLALGGGSGFLARKFGLTCDVIKNITLVTADGSIITADSQNFSDLFWALRGAGADSFGIVLGFTFEVFYVPRVGFIELDWEWDPAKVPLTIKAWQSWITTLPEDITAELDLDYVNGQRTVTVIAVKVGSTPFTEWQSAFSNLDPHITINKTIRYVDAARLVGGNSPLPYLKTKSKMLFTPLPDAAITIIIQFFQDLHANNKQFCVHLELDSAGGKSAQGDTAYFPRQALAWFFQHMRWNDQNQEADALAAINTFYAAIAPYCSPYSYANIIDYDLGNDYLTAYYGDHVDRLIHIKNKYDPTNVFHWKQSIPLAK
jgi:FAD/FMN-containing dehydrogenase